DDFNPFDWSTALDFDFSFIDISQQPSGRGDSFVVLVSALIDKEAEPVVVLPFEHLDPTVCSNSPKWTRIAPEEPDAYVLGLLSTELFSKNGGICAQYNEWGSGKETDDLGGFATALVCDGSVCRLDGVFNLGDPPQFEPIPNGEVPLPEVRGMVGIFDYEQNSLAKICAFGDGIVCFDGFSWLVELEPGSGPLFNDVALRQDENRNNKFIIAVGEEGRIAQQNAEGWIELDLKTDADLYSVSTAHDYLEEGFWAAAGADGALVVGLPDSLLECRVADETISLVHTQMNSSCYEQQQRELFLFTESGQVISIVYNHDEQSSCRYSQFLDGPVIGNGVQFLVGGAMNILVTLDSIYQGPRFSSLCPPP
ncbi:MAG: hypothetical protein GY847_28515, partial [Proteobacteria bacterium]|nr:hypothetical protein [Pseudomonadota bacterium]